MAEVVANINSRIARLRPVKKDVHGKAKQLAARAKALLKGHRDTGTARIRVSRGKVDSFVSMEDEHGNAASIEYGRAAGTSANGRKYGAMQGLYILHRTIGLR